MLPTPAIKADSPGTSAGAGTKDKDAASLALDATFSAYFSQMVAALPSLTASLPSAPARDAAPRAAVRPADDNRRPAPAATPASAKAGQDAPSGAVQAGGAAPAPPQPPPQPAQAVAASTTGQGQTDAATPQAGSPASPSPASPSAASPAATAAGVAQASAKAVQDLASTAPAAAAPVTAAVADAQAQAAAKVQDALDQAVPGAKFQIQYGDAAPVTSKQPLSELVSPIQMVTGPSVPVQKSSLPEIAPASPAVDPAAALQALQALQAPQAGPTALLALPAPATAAAGTALAGSSAAGAQAVSAGAQPGASGAVRVTASAGSGSSRPAGDPSLFSQVDGTIRWLVKNQDQGAELQLHPESLGRIQIKLKIEGSVVHAKVWASDAAAVPVLQEHRSSLEASLKAQGLTLGSFDLQHGHRQQQAPLPDPSAAFAPALSPALPGTGQESPVAVVQAASHTSRIEYVA